MEAVLHDEEIEIAERMLEKIDVGEGDEGVGSDDPERTDSLGEQPASMMSG